MGYRTDIGRQRSFNEDALLIGDRIWAVADGMGGHAAGDVASALVVNRLSDLDALDQIRPADVVAAVTAANEDVLGYSRDNPTAWGLGTTVTGLVRCELAGAPHWAVFNVGDSRVYRMVGGRLSRATVDHSETEELILAGQITEEQARTHALRNVITRSVGTFPAPRVDLWVLPQTPGERFLVCSDGLTGELTDERIEALLADHPDPTAAADALIAAVLRTRARDNVTVIVIDVGGDDEAIDETTTPRGAILQGDRG